MNKFLQWFNIYVGYSWSNNPLRPKVKSPSNRYENYCYRYRLYYNPKRLKFNNGILKPQYTPNETERSFIREILE